MIERRPPKRAFPELTGWRSVGVNDPVFTAERPGGVAVYVRADDGSATVLDRLLRSEVPAPRVLDQRGAWLVLEALSGRPLNDDRWLTRPAEVPGLIADALARISRAGVTHGDMCVPNILGDPTTGELSGIVDWGDAGRFGREIDVASAIWSCAYNGYPEPVARRALELIGWPACDAAEVRRLSDVWEELAGPAC